MAGRLPAVVIDNGTGYAIRFYLLSNQKQTRSAHLKCKVPGWADFILLSPHNFCTILLK